MNRQDSLCFLGNSTMKNQNIYKLLKISSIGYQESYTGKNFNEELNNILKKKNGFYTFESALHFFSNNEIENITSLIKNRYQYDSIENCLFFAEDIFGNLFCYDNVLNIIFLLDLESGQKEELGSSFEEWAKKILEDYDYLTGYSIAHEWQVKNGSLNKNIRLFPEIPFILGGEYNINNLKEIEQMNGIKKKFELYKQIKDMHDGEKVVFVK